jgi:hypothetical protein
MPSADSRIKKVAISMKQCYKSEDAPGFLAAAQALRDIGAEALGLGILADATFALSTLKVGLEQVNGFLPERDGLLSNLYQCSTEFIESVMPAFSVNGFEVINNIGLSNKVDDYLFAEKVRVDQLNAGDPSYQLLFWCLRQDRFSQYVEGIEAVVDELLYRQEEAMILPDFQRRVSGSQDYMVQYGFFLHMGDVVKNNIGLPPLSAKLDEKLAKVFSNLCHGDSLSISGSLLNALIAAGLHKSCAAAIGNAYSCTHKSTLNIEHLKDPSAQVVVRAFLLFNQHQTAPDIIKKMLTFDAVDLLDLLQDFVGKKFNFQSGYVINSCVQFMATEDYKPEHQDIVLCLLEAAALRIQQGLRPGQLDYEVILETMTKAGVPEKLQFRIGNIRKNRGKILELNLGM